MMGSAQDRVLDVLRANGEPMTTREIAAMVGDLDTSGVLVRSTFTTLRRLSKWGDVEKCGKVERRPGIREQTWRAAQ